MKERESTVDAVCAVAASVNEVVRVYCELRRMIITVMCFANIRLTGAFPQMEYIHRGKR